MPEHIEACTHYDTEVVPAIDTPQEVGFFERSLSEQMLHSVTVKTLSHTNKNSVGLPFIFECFGLNCEIPILTALKDFKELFGAHWCVCKCGYEGMWDCSDYDPDDVPEDAVFENWCPQCLSRGIQFRHNTGLFALDVGDSAIVRVPLVELPLASGPNLDLKNFYRVSTVGAGGIKFEKGAILRGRVSWLLRPPKLSADVALTIMLNGQNYM